MKIIYETNAGATERYAQMLAEKLQCPCEKLSSCGSTQEEVIFCGWVMCGTIQGLASAKEKCTNIKAVVAVGMMANDKEKASLLEKNPMECELFYIFGAFNLKKLHGMYKIMMNMMMKMIKSKMKDCTDPDEKKAYELFEEGFDAVSETQLEPVLEFVLKE